MVEPQTEPVPRRRAANAWHWLLLIPIVVPLLVILFNNKNPYFLGFPRFYWLQLVFILLSVATTLVVYNVTKNREG